MPAAGNVAEEDQARAGLYRLLAAFLTAPPSADLLDATSGLTGDGTVLGAALGELARAAKATSSAAAADEYQDLFIGLTRGEILPYASYYLTGFLNEKPLARLRSDMARLEIAADRSFSEPEDHAAAVLESMAGLIDGTFGRAIDIDDQRAFFESHIASWAPLMFRDVAQAKSAHLYRAVAALGTAFLTIEREAFQRD
ncbi:MAG: molecular chaperone TorD family protein [Hyphomicrobiaceae bacterium]